MMMNARLIIVVFNTSSTQDQEEEVDKNEHTTHCHCLQQHQHKTMRRKMTTMDKTHCHLSFFRTTSAHN